jgi:hypothetical protein
VIASCNTRYLLIFLILLLQPPLAITLSTGICSIAWQPERFLSVICTARRKDDACRRCDRKHASSLSKISLQISYLWESIWRFTLKWNSRFSLKCVYAFISHISTFFFFSLLRFETDSTWYVGHYLAYRTNPRWWCIYICGAVSGMICKGNRSTWRELLQCHLSTTNPTWPDLRSNSSRRSGKPAINHWAMARSESLVSYMLTCLPEIIYKKIIWPHEGASCLRSHLSLSYSIISQFLWNPTVQNHLQKLSSLVLTLPTSIQRIQRNPIF